MKAPGGLAMGAGFVAVLVALVVNGDPLWLLVGLLLIGGGWLVGRDRDS